MAEKEFVTDGQTADPIAVCHTKFPLRIKRSQKCHKVFLALWTHFSDISDLMTMAETQYYFQLQDFHFPRLVGQVQR